MKPNVQLNHIIGLSMDLGCLISIDTPLNEVSVFFKADFKTSQLDDRDGMNKIADWLSLSVGSGVAEAVGDIAEAKAEAVKAVKQQVDNPRWENRNLLDITSPSVLSS